MGTQSKRRPGTIPARTYWSEDAITAIEQYQARHGIGSFSAAAEALVRLGLEQSPTEILQPIIESSIRQAIHRDLDRLVRLQVLTAIDSGMAWRFAAAGTRDVGRIKQDPPERYEEIKAMAIREARRSLRRDHLRSIVADYMPELSEPEAANTLAEAMGLADDLIGNDTGQTTTG